MRIHRSAATAAASFLLMAGAVMLTAPAASAGAPGGTHADDRNCDFNGDGYDDLLVAAPNAVASGSEGAGLVSVQYGGRGGLDTHHARLFTRATPGIEGPAVPQDHFGASVASGDLDADGYDDAIIGIPGDDFSGESNSGGVVVLWGSSTGLSGVNSTLIEAPEPVANAHFGSAVTAARLSGATSGDVLAVLDDHDVRLFTYKTRPGRVNGAGMAGTAKTAGRAKAAKAAKTAGATRQATGAAAEATTGSTAESVTEPRTGSATEPGSGSAVARSGGSRAAAGHSASWSVERLKLPAGAGTAASPAGRNTTTTTTPTGAAGKEAGSTTTTRQDGGRVLTPRSLTTGDYDDNGYADLVISGVDDGQGSDGTDIWHGWSAYLAGGADGPAWVRDLRGGPAVASGDINRDGYDDLVTGAPQPPDAPDAPGGSRFVGGLVAVHFGGPEGPGGPDTRDQYWSQDSLHVPGVGEPGDDWGADVSVGDTDGDGYADVAIGAPGEDRDSVADAGSVTVLRGGPGGLTMSGVHTWSQDSPGIPGADEPGDRWGAQVRLADPNGNGRSELLAAAPGENSGDGVMWLLPATSGGITATGSWTYGLGSLGSPHSGAAYGAAIDE